MSLSSRCDPCLRCGQVLGALQPTARRAPARGFRASRRGWPPDRPLGTTLMLGNGGEDVADALHQNTQRWCSYVFRRIGPESGYPRRHDMPAGAANADPAHRMPIITNRPPVYESVAGRGHRDRNVRQVREARTCPPRTPGPAPGRDTAPIAMSRCSYGRRPPERA